jgi:NADPH:quinone reductase-like Zn-dependent oxidoreductase
MKAVVQEGYGSPDTLKLRGVEMPVPGDDGVLVEVHAASVNALDWHLVRGVPVFIRNRPGPTPSTGESRCC